MKSLLEDQVRKSRLPARLDLIQSLSGLALGIFMWTHLVLVSSILLGKDAMMALTHFMELRFLNPDEPDGYPLFVSLVALGVFALFILHAALAMRKFPSTWKENQIMRSHIKMMHHTDTTQWYTQVVTGFIMFFLGSVHLYIMLTNPSNIGPYASADRFVTEWMWPLYLVLLFSVELHATIGMYRLAVKWGVFDGKNPRATRKRLKLVKNVLTTFFLVLGLLSFAAYVKIGIEHRDRAGERYVSSVSIDQPVAMRGVAMRGLVK